MKDASQFSSPGKEAKMKKSRNKTSNMSKLAKYWSSYVEKIGYGCYNNTNARPPHAKEHYEQNIGANRHLLI